jgi:hypothetical protein
MTHQSEHPTAHPTAGAEDNQLCGLKFAAQRRSIYEVRDTHDMICGLK